MQILLWLIFSLGVLGGITLGRYLIHVQQDMDSLHDCVEALCRAQSQQRQGLEDLASEIAEARLSRNGLSPGGDEPTLSLFD